MCLNPNKLLYLSNTNALQIARLDIILLFHFSDCYRKQKIYVRSHFGGQNVNVLILFLMYVQRMKNSAMILISRALK